MLKKILTITAVFAASFSNVFAAQFYAAPSIGYEDVRTTNNSRYQGLIPILGLGWGGLYYPWLYMAAELFGAWHSLDLNNEPKDGLSVKTEYSWGGSVILGYPLEENLMLYLRLGLVSTSFDKIDETKTGYQAGIGAEVPITCNWYARAEFDFMRYDRVSTLGQPQIIFWTLGAVYRFG